MKTFTKLLHLNNTFENNLVMKNHPGSVNSWFINKNLEMKPGIINNDILKPVLLQYHLDISTIILL